MQQSKNGHQFIDFLKRVEKRYDTPKTSLLCLITYQYTNQKRYKEISKCCPRIKFVFPPVRSPELNLIEGGYGYKDRQLTIQHLKMGKK